MKHSSQKEQLLRIQIQSQPRRVSSQLPTCLDPDPVQAFPSGLPSRLFIPFARPPPRPRPRLPRPPPRLRTPQSSSLVGRLGCSPSFPGEQHLASRFSRSDPLVRRCFYPLRMYLSKTATANVYGGGIAFGVAALYSCPYLQG